MAMEAAWPVFALGFRSPNLGLRVVRDDDLQAVLAAVNAGIHDPAGKRARVRPGPWHLSFPVLLNDVPIRIHESPPPT